MPVEFPGCSSVKVEQSPSESGIPQCWFNHPFLLTQGIAASTFALVYIKLFFVTADAVL